MAKVFPDTANNSPDLTPGWTVQNAVSGSNGTMDDVTSAELPHQAHVTTGQLTDVQAALNTLFDNMIADLMMKA